MASSYCKMSQVQAFLGWKPWKNIIANQDQNHQWKRRLKVNFDFFIFENNGKSDFPGLGKYFSKTNIFLALQETPQPAEREAKRFLEEEFPKLQQKTEDKAAARVSKADLKIYFFEED